MIDLDELFKKLQDFGHRVMIAISIEAAGLLPPSYDKLLRKRRIRFRRARHASRKRRRTLTKAMAKSCYGCLRDAELRCRGKALRLQGRRRRDSAKPGARVVRALRIRPRYVRKDEWLAGANRSRRSASIRESIDTCPVCRSIVCSGCRREDLYDEPGVAQCRFAAIVRSTLGAMIFASSEKKSQRRARTRGPSAITRFPAIRAWFLVGTARATARPARYSRRSVETASSFKYSSNVRRRRSGGSMR